MAISSTLTVDLGERSYPIVIGSGLIGEFDLTKYLNGPDCLVVTNETVGPLYIKKAQKKLPPDSVVVCLPDGEEHKTLRNAAKVLDQMVASQANRDATVVALGGGVDALSGSRRPDRRHRWPPGANCRARNPRIVIGIATKIAPTCYWHL